MANVKCRKCKALIDKDNAIKIKDRVYYCKDCHSLMLDDGKREQEFSSLYNIVLDCIHEQPYIALRKYLNEVIDKYTYEKVYYYFSREKLYLSNLYNRKTFKNKNVKIAYLRAVLDNNIPKIVLPKKEVLNKDVDYHDTYKYKRQKKRKGMAEIEKSILLNMEVDDE